MFTESTKAVIQFIYSKGLSEGMFPKNLPQILTRVTTEDKVLLDVLTSIKCVEPGAFYMIDFELDQANGVRSVWSNESYTRIEFSGQKLVVKDIKTHQVVLEIE